MINSIVLSGDTQTGGQNSGIKGEEITYSSKLKGYITYDVNKKGKRPGVLVVPEWWGNNDYSRMRARKLAELGYIAMAVDIYGDGKIASNPAEAIELSGPFYKNPQLAKSRLEAAENKLKAYSQVDEKNIAAIGYCFGGSMCLNSAKLGIDLKGVVSFHGRLAGVPPDKNLLKAEILVCHGGADKFVSNEDEAAFKKALDSISAKYTFKVYEGAMHAYSNPAATELGKQFSMPIEYNEAADKESWNDMIAFFIRIF